VPPSLVLQPASPFTARRRFTKDSPWPTELNWFHARTREVIIRNEVLLQPGATWDPVRVVETERNLRRLYILAVAKVVAARGEQGGVTG
jgi:hypothetical protein